MRRHHNCPAEGTLMKTGGAYEKLSLVRGGASWLLAVVLVYGNFILIFDYSKSFRCIYCPIAKNENVFGF